mmetsp:Transcript_12657/g.16623  ORF Transcript_12657/g.16623 Transcript_12657/m.16623 type:complete len:549 (-) Transcript_12657:32-1678(-)
MKILSSFTVLLTKAFLLCVPFKPNCAWIRHSKFGLSAPLNAPNNFENIINAKHVDCLSNGGSEGLQLFPVYMEKNADDISRNRKFWSKSGIHYAFSSQYDRNIVTLSLPALISLLSGPFLSLVDTVFVGRLGTISLGALGPSTMVFNLLFGLYRAVTLATTSLIARALANEKKEEASQIAKATMCCTTIVGVLTTFLLKAFPAFFLSLMGLGKSSEIFLEAKSYLTVRALAAPFVLAITVGEGVFRGMTDSLTPTKIAAVAAVANFILDPLFIFRFAWGVSGAAFATVLAQVFSAVLYIILLSKKGGLLSNPKTKTTFSLKRPLLSSQVSNSIENVQNGFPVLLKILSANTAMLMRYAASVASWSFFTSKVTQMGTTCAASHQVASSIWLFLTIAAEALSVSAQVLGGKLFAAKKMESAKQLTIRLWALSLMYGCGIFGVLSFLQQPIASLFTTDAKVISLLCTEVMCYIAYMQPISAFTLVTEGLLIGAGEFRWLWTTTVFATLSVLMFASRLDLSIQMIWKLLTSLFVLRSIFGMVRMKRIFTPDI